MRNYKTSDFWVEFIAIIIFVAITALIILLTKNAEKRSEKRIEGPLKQTVVNQNK